MRLERINKRKSKRRSENLKVLGYIRVSAISQKDNTSLEDQEQKIMEFCKLNDYELVEIFRDIESGAERSRRGYQTMLAMLEESGFDGVVSSKIDRLYRSLQAMADLFTVIDEKGKFIHTVDGVHSRNGYGQFMAKILGLVAEMERKHIKERVRGGRIANFQKYGKQGGNGKGVTGKAPFGYYWQDGVLMIDEGKAAIVKRIFKKRNKGSSLC